MGGSRTCTSALKDTELLDASKSPSVMLVCGCILEAEAACFVKNGFVKNSNRETDEVRVEQKIALICIKKYTQTSKRSGLFFDCHCVSHCNYAIPV